MPSQKQSLMGANVVLLDGATGTELERRGFALERPGWSARAIEDAPELLRLIHRDYVEAGAEIITANTFRLHQRNLASWGREDDDEKLVKRAVDLAREAAGKRALIAASIAPIGDCYSPEQVPSASDLEAEHSVLAGHLARAGVELILVETMVSSREGLAAAKAAAKTGSPFVVSFVCGPDARLLSGTSLAEAIGAVLPLNPTAVCVNCISVAHVLAALQVLRDSCGATPFGVYANTGERGSDGVWNVTNAAEPAVYAVSAQRWKELGARLIGGCCGTTPDHIHALKLSLQS